MTHEHHTANIQQTLHGTVENVSQKSVTIVFQHQDDIIERNYPISEFIDQIPPNEGDQATLQFSLTCKQIILPPTDTTIIGEEYPRKKITGPIEF